MTPLLLAARSGQDGVVRLLLERGADVMATDADGRNCLDIAIDKGHRLLCRMPEPKTEPLVFA